MKNQSAFTLLELLLVVAIIAVISSMAYLSFQGSQTAARDTKKQVELKQYQVLLETYSARNNNLYPITSGRGTTICSTVSSTATCPVAPNYTTT
ncbi:type II secretion system protein, partial [Patescibacteria group bacterium]|nr:type II secretion system protein [Patescibacteria group bacterium]